MADEEVVDYSPELNKNCAESIAENELAQKRVGGDICKRTNALTGILISYCAALFPYLN